MHSWSCVCVCVCFSWGIKCDLFAKRVFLLNNIRQHIFSQEGRDVLDTAGDHMCLSALWEPRRAVRDRLGTRPTAIHDSHKATAHLSAICHHLHPGSESSQRETEMICSLEGITKTFVFSMKKDVCCRRFSTFLTVVFVLSLWKWNKKTEM